jgi:hypothetical protein
MGTASVGDGDVRPDVSIQDWLERARKCDMVVLVDRKGAARSHGLQGLLCKSVSLTA